MKKVYLSLALLTLLGTTQARTQTLLDEDFETGSTELSSLPVTRGSGWTTEGSYTGDALNFKWHNYYSKKGALAGSTNCAACDGPTWSGDKNNAFGPRDEKLITPELDLNDTYQLKFTWKVGPANAQESSRYDLQVRVIVSGTTDTTTVFSIQDKNLLAKSGVLVYPITTWDPHTSQVDLSAWKGKKVKLAFVYKMYTKYGNIACIDDVTVKQFTPYTSPSASIDNSSYKFPKMYVGEKFYTTPFTLKNDGLDGLKVTGLELPAGVSTTWDYSSVNLKQFESTKFQLAYTASLTSPVDANAVIHTTGGDVTIHLTATKEVVPEGYMLESFNSSFPPAGWKNSGWNRTDKALEGDGSAYASASYNDAYLVSPRLDLTKGGQLKFTYINVFTSEDGGSYQTNNFRVDVSYDNGKNWTTKWTYDVNNGGMDNYSEQTVDLGQGTDSSYVRFVDTAVEYDSEEGAGEFADIYVDRVLLPNVYGADQAPQAPTLVAPKNKATELLPKNIEFKWEPVLFAKGYKLYVGSDDAATNLVNGLDVKDATTYTLATAGYGTTYNWKVVPYNDKGDATKVPVWTFTTQPDASVSAYPYEENFTNGSIPNGWTVEAAASYNRKWSVNDYYPYTYGNVKSNVLMSAYMAAANEHTAVTTQQFRLPADKNMKASFVWTNVHPSDAVVDATGAKTKKNVSPNNGASACSFQVSANGTDWTTLSYISEKGDDASYWKTEDIDLSAYAGQTVQFRWLHESFANYNRDGGSSVAHFVVSEAQGLKAEFNKPSWDAGIVNYGKANNSGNALILLNKGTKELKVASVSFATPNFTTSLAAGDVIAVGANKAFSIQFNSNETAAKVTDKMTVNFEGGYSTTFDVSGEALRQDQLYYGFENNSLDYSWKNDFTMFDVDNTANEKFTYYLSQAENDASKYAFTQVWLNNPNATAYDGTGALLTGTPVTGAGDDWLVSKAVKAGSNATFSFYARNLEQTNSVLPAGKNKIAVLVSTTDNASTSSFTEKLLAEEEIPYLGTNEWKQYSFDLSKYAGKTIYVAIHHTSAENVMEAFYDHFLFEGLDTTTNGIESVKTVGADSDVTVYSVAGTLVASGKAAQVLGSLHKGLYVVKAKEGSNVKTFRYARK